MAVNGRSREQIITKIENIEQQLRDLRLELTEQNNNEPAPSPQDIELKIGDQVIINNPRPGQPGEGKVSKIHQRTGRITVTAVNGRGRELKIVRVKKNLTKLREE